MTERTQVRRLPEKAVTGIAALHEVLDAAVVAHMAVVEDGQPFVLPVACARDGDRLLLHGSTGSRLFRTLAAGAPTCATVTLLDGLLLARSAFESSLHYRSAMILGTATPLQGDEHLEALRVLTEHLLPGRWAQLRPPTRKELAATAVLALPLTEWSVKVSDSPPDDDPADLGAPVWAGAVPLRMVPGSPVAAPDLADGMDGAADVAAITERVGRWAPPPLTW
ncbi:MAG TPA: pyridoxamine 5'-phosphate oxidase family protein [Actinomycetota bacterium]|nr:pyridoxamine 5'-phosphate oxidase family protein [Actinomycetota bacterium]